MKEKEKRNKELEREGGKEKKEIIQESREKNRDTYSGGHTIVN